MRVNVILFSLRKRSGQFELFWPWKRPCWWGRQAAETWRRDGRFLYHLKAEARRDNCPERLCRLTEDQPSITLSNALFRPKSSAKAIRVPWASKLERMGCSGPPEERLLAFKTVFEGSISLTACDHLFREDLGLHSGGRLVFRKNRCWRC